MSRKNPFIIQKPNDALQIMRQTVRKKKNKTVKQKKASCPKTKPLYNPKTNRCVTDNTTNRKKLGLLLKESDKPKKKVLTIIPKQSVKPQKTRKTHASMKMPSLTKKSLKSKSLKRLIPVELSKKTYTEYI